MSLPIATGPGAVEFSGARSGRGGLTWGQQRFWRMMVEQPDGRHNYVPLFLEVPEARRLGVDEALSCLRTLAVRHDSLRTTYLESPSGERTQYVAGRGALPVDVLPMPPTGVRGVQEHLFGPMRERLFSPRELPVRTAVFTEGDVVRHVALLFSPIAVDDWSRALLEEEWHTLVAESGRDPAVLTTGPAAAADEPWQPLRQRAWEQGPEGRRRSRAALTHWERQLSLPAPLLFSRDRAEPGNGARAGFHEAFLTSFAVSAAGGRLAERFGTSVHTVLTAGILAAVGARADTSLLHFATVVNNRFAPRSRSMVGALSQTVTACVDIRGKDFGEIVRATYGALLPAYRCAAYDPEALEEVTRRVRRATGRVADPPLLFNVTNSRAVPGLPEARPAGRPRELMPRTTFRWGHEPAEGQVDLYIGARPHAERTGFFSRGDARVVPRQEIGTILMGVEAVLVAAAEGHRLPPRALRALVGA